MAALATRNSARGHGSSCKRANWRSKGGEARGVRAQAPATATPPPPPAASTSGRAASASLRPAQQQPPAVAPLRFADSYYDAEGRLVLKNLTLPELEAWRGARGARRGEANGFSAAFREKLAPLATLDAGLELQSLHAAADGTLKLVFKLRSGPAAGGQVETVLIPIVREQGSKPRITLCVSSQVGCAMNCQFCYTGRMGLQGNLTPGQIVEQMVAARRLLWEEDVAAGAARHITPVTNVVYMAGPVSCFLAASLLSLATVWHRRCLAGMGEPMHNLDAVLPSVEILCHPMGLHLSATKITVSTVGLLPEMRRFVASSRAVLAVSLHATTDEYTMLRGVNDALEDAARLLALTARVRCKVNLIVFNPHPGSPFQPSTPEQVQAFRSALIQGGHVATVRNSRGDDEMAACGQLGSFDPAAERQRPLPPLLPPPERLRAAVGALA
eukprot:scaffold14.g1273.t1